jgi:carboxymethylenebutenolidase
MAKLQFQTKLMGPGFAGTAHGFACRPNTELPEVMDAYEKAFQQTVDWFQKTLVV